MSQGEILKILKKTGAIITNSHFVYTSGMHGSGYINKDAIYPHTRETSKLCKLIAEKFKNKKIEIVVAPALGGIILSQWVAYHLSRLSGREVLAVYTEKTADNQQIFTRGYDELIKGKKVLVVEDVTTTGSSVKKTVDSVKKAEGKIVAVTAVVNRNPNITSKTVGGPFYPMSTIIMDAWEEENCQLCRKQVPINTTVGKGRQFLERLKKI